MFVDDDTDCVAGSEPETLLRKIQKEADISCDWLRDNRMVVAGQKSKFLIVGTKEMRNKKCDGQISTIYVDGKQVCESKSEKLLGIIVNNTMSWKEYLYGETWRTEVVSNNKGLLNQLSQRLGILKKLSRVASKKTFKMIAQGIFYSKMSYCFPLFLNTWGLDHYRDGSSRNSSLMKKDLYKLQVLQNQVIRLMFNNNRVSYTMSTSELLTWSGDLSVHQQGALSTLCLTKKILITKKPSYLATQLENKVNRGTRSGTTLYHGKCKLGLTREGFVYRAVKLYNLIPDDLRNESKLLRFKSEVKKWVAINIPVKP